jgi:hypothetical protein
MEIRPRWPLALRIGLYPIVTSQYKLNHFIPDLLTVSVAVFLTWQSDIALPDERPPAGAEWPRVPARGGGVTVRARPGRSSALRFFHSKSILYGAFAWARRALNRRKRRVSAPPGRTDYDTVHRVVARDGRALKYAGPALQADRRIVLAAVVRPAASDPRASAASGSRASAASGSRAACPAENTVTLALALRNGPPGAGAVPGGGGVRRGAGRPQAGRGGRAHGRRGGGPVRPCGQFRPGTRCSKPF